MKEHCPHNRNVHSELSAVGENASIGWAIIYSDPRILDSKIRNEPKEKLELTRINECCFALSKTMETGLTIGAALMHGNPSNSPRSSCS